MSLAGLNKEEQQRRFNTFHQKFSSWLGRKSFHLFETLGLPIEIFLEEVSKKPTAMLFNYYYEGALEEGYNKKQAGRIAIHTIDSIGPIALNTIKELYGNIGAYKERKVEADSIPTRE